MRFEGQLVIKAPIRKVWDVFQQVELLALCIPGCESVEPIEGDRYRALLVETLGMFRVSFATDIKIDEVDPKRSIKASASGVDRKLASSFRQTLEAMFVESTDTETAVSLVTDVQFVGKVAGVGHGIIKRKADEALVKFGNCVRRHLEAG